MHWVLVPTFTKISQGAAPHEFRAMVAASLHISLNCPFVTMLHGVATVLSWVTESNWTKLDSQWAFACSTGTRINAPMASTIGESAAGLFMISSRSSAVESEPFQLKMFGAIKAKLSNAIESTRFSRVFDAINPTYDRSGCASRGTRSVRRSGTESLQTLCSAGRMPALMSRRMRWCVTPSVVAASDIVSHSPFFSAER
jgi:hypothetical protein